MFDDATGRPNQKSRTRKDLLAAAARLMKQGNKITLDEVAEEAMVSRSTAYRYFPSVEALIVEAPIDDAVPDPRELFSGSSPDDPIERLQIVDTALHNMIAANEPALRMMLSQSIQRGVNGEHGNGFPARQNRRTALIEAALAPARDRFQPAALNSLTRALALIVGTESMIVFTDVLQVDDAEARNVRRWAIRALVESATKPG